MHLYIYAYSNAQVEEGIQEIGIKLIFLRFFNSAN